MTFRHSFCLMICILLVTSGCSNSVSNIEEQGEGTAKSDDRATSSTFPSSTDRGGDRRETPVSTVSSQGAAAKTGKFDWPRWRGPDANSISRETGLIHEFPSTGPQILWRKTLGSGFSGLTVSGGRVFTLFGEDGREKVVCFNADTGEQIWKIDSDADFSQGRSFGPRATPCVDSGRVYAVGASGKLHCLDEATGKTVWSFNLYQKYGLRPHDEGLSCSPLIDGKKLIVAAGTSVFAFDKTTGKVIWKVLDEKMNHSTPTFDTIDGRRQLVVLTGSNLVGLDPASGRELWRHGQRAVNCVTPVVAPDSQIFAGAAYGFGCQLVRIADGTAKQIYKNKNLAAHHATPVLYKGHLYGFHDRPGIFKCIDFATGEEKWESRSPGKGKLIIADGQMILITEYGQLVLAKPSPDGYVETAKAQVVKGTCYTAPTLANGKLYVRSDKEMVCIPMKK